MKHGFTMAEVLITLGVIGVIAAMTLPAVIANYQKQSTISKLKKFYTNFNQTLIMAKTENGDFNTWNYSSSLEFYEKYVKPYIKNVNKTLSPLTIYNVGSDTVLIVFNDGTCCAIHVIGWNSPKIAFFTKYPQKIKKNWIGLWVIEQGAIDKPQRDIFFFKFNSNGQITPVNTISGSNRNNFINSCKTCANPGCYACTSLIYFDNWKISDDYPW